MFSKWRQNFNQKLFDNQTPTLTSPKANFLWILWFLQNQHGLFSVGPSVVWLCCYMRLNLELPRLTRLSHHLLQWSVQCNSSIDTKIKTPMKHPWGKTLTSTYPQDKNFYEKKFETHEIPTRKYLWNLAHSVKCNTTLMFFIFVPYYSLFFWSYSFPSSNYYSP